MRSSRKKMPVPLGFVAGALFGAVAVFVPLSSAGHSKPNAAASEVGRADVRSSSLKDRPADPKPAVPASTKEERPTPSPESNRDTCEVQLD